jgi:DNA-binding FadR family transcriptional regulator
MRRALDDRNAGAARDDLAAFIDGDTRFHMSLASASHNSLLSDLYESLNTAFRTSIGHAIGQGTEDHEALYRAIEDRDSVTAMELSLAIIARMEDMEETEAAESAAAAEGNGESQP